MEPKSKKQKLNKPKQKKMSNNNINFNQKLRDYFNGSSEGKKSLNENIYMGTKHSYDYSDKKKSDNMDMNQILLGIQNELTKNPHITLDAAMRNVERALAADPQAYIKDGEFGIEGVGYKELPGSKKKAAGKYKASGYGETLADSTNVDEQVMMESLKEITISLIERSGLNTNLMTNEAIYRLAKETISEVKYKVGIV